MTKAPFAGMTVNFVLKNGDIRPLTITRVARGSTNINGVLALEDKVVVARR